MARTVNQIVSELDIREPYVWRLQLTEDEFMAIKSHALGHVSVKTQTDALAIIVYLAEWYKRQYKSGTESPLTTDVVRKAWEMSGISIDKYVYRTEAATHLWQYSIFVLGGLAINHELSRNDKGKFLKALCRVYHGEDYTLENLDDASRAISFRKSISERHSLYEYLRAILNGELEPEDEQTLTLVCRIKSANDEILRSKFRLEWIITFPKYEKGIYRSLRVWLKPEEVGGGLHDYLRYDRVHLWGIPHPEELVNLYFSLRWKDGEKVIQDIDKQKPLIVFSNRRNDGTYVTWGVEQCATFRDVPSERFTSIEIVAFDEQGNEYITHQEPVKEWMQLWRIEPSGSKWSSRQNAQHQTAVIYSDRYLVDREPDDKRKFGGLSIWNWNYIQDKITLTDGTDTFTLYNRIGYDQVFTRTYSNIRYVQGDLVKHCYIDDPEESEDHDEEFLPLVFGKNDVLIRHFATKDAIKEAIVENESVADKVEFKQFNGIFAVWDDTNHPSFGKNILRVESKGVTMNIKVMFLPSLTADNPVLRDFEKQRILYRDFDGAEKEYDDVVELTNNSIHPVAYIFYHIDGEEDYVELEVYHALLKKEIVVDGNVVRRIEDGEQLSLPYILKYRTVLCDFNRDGYRKYDFRNMESIYNLLGDQTNAHLAAWEKGYTVQATDLDGDAPDWLFVSLGDKEYAGQQGLSILYWDYSNDKEPMEVMYNYSGIRGSLVFQSMTRVDKELTCLYPIIVHGGAWGLKGRDISELKCFEIAMKNKVYFYMFEPLARLDKQKAIQRIIEPLLEKEGNQLTDEVIDALKRFEEEMKFKIYDI